jgi:hypothetical protein
MFQQPIAHMLHRLMIFPSNSKRTKWSCQEQKSFYYPLLLTYLQSCNYPTSKLYPFCSLKGKSVPSVLRVSLCLLSGFFCTSVQLNFIVVQIIDHLSTFLCGLLACSYQFIPTAFNHIQNIHPHTQTIRNNTLNNFQLPPALFLLVSFWQFNSPKD